MTPSLARGEGSLSNFGADIDKVEVFIL